MASPIDVLVSSIQSSQINKSGNLQSGVATPQVQAKPEVDTAPVPKVKAASQPAETLASFRSSVGIDPVAVQAVEKQDDKRVDANLQALKAFAATGSLADAGDGSIAISV